MLDVQLLRATAATLSVSWLSGTTVVDPGTVTATVTRADGTVLSGLPAVGGSGAAARTLALSPAHTAELDILSVTWVSATLGEIEQRVEILGDLAFTISELRSFHDGAISEAAYPDAVVEAARARVLDEFEHVCGVAFVPRYRLATLDGRGGRTLMLPSTRVTRLRSLATRSGATWTAYTVDDLADVLLTPWGQLTRETRGTFPSGTDLIRVGYEHGYARIPREISRAALIATRYELVASDISSRAISISSEGGTQQLWTPGYSGRGAAVHELPAVDKVLQRFSERMPGVA